MTSADHLTVSADDKKNHGDHAEKHSAHGKYEGMNESRWTTDIIFLLLILFMWAAMSGVGGNAVQNGNPYRLIAPFDYTGSNCGFSPSVQNEKYFYTVLTSGLGVCTDGCPTYNSANTSYSSSDYYCLGYINTVADTLIVPSGYSTLDYYIKESCMTNGVYDISKQCGCNLKRKATNVLRRCIFDDSSVRDHYSNQNEGDYFTNFISDIITARYIIFCFGFLTAVLVSFAYSQLLRIPSLALCLTWTSILFVFALSCCLVGLAWNTALSWANQDPPTHSHRSVLALKAFSLILLGFSVIYIFLMIFVCKQINLAVRTVSLAATAIAQMPLIAFIPLIHLALSVIFMIPCMFYMFNIASEGSWTTVYTTYTNPVTSASVSYPIGRKYALDNNKAGEELWFLYFCMLWTLNFISAIGSLVIAVASARWYFTKPEERVTNINSRNILAAYQTVLRYHIGTAAFGSLIIAIIQFIRTVAVYIQKHFKQYTNNIIVRVVFCCIDCCLWCLEKCMKFVCKQAYIQTAIHGTSFIFACKDAFFTIARNVFRVGAIAVVSGLALLIGKLLVMVTAAVTSYFWFDTYYRDQMYDFIAPTVLIMILAWFTATMFMDVFGMVIDTLIMCFITDEEQNGTAKFADPSTSSFIEEHGKIDPASVAAPAAAATPAAAAAPAAPADDDRKNVV